MYHHRQIFRLRHIRATRRALSSFSLVLGEIWSTGSRKERATIAGGVFHAETTLWTRSNRKPSSTISRLIQGLPNQTTCTPEYIIIALVPLLLQRPLLSHRNKTTTNGQPTHTTTHPSFLAHEPRQTHCTANEPPVSVDNREY